MLRHLLATAVLLLALALPARAETVADYIARAHPSLDETAAAVLAPLGSMSSYEKLFVDRLATLSPESQREYAVSLALDGRIGPDDLAALPVAVALPDDPTGILPLLAERVRADYWPGFYRRNRFAVHSRLRHWRATAERRYDDPEFAQKLIDIFFLMIDGTYDGPMTLEYRPAQQDLHRAAD